MFVLVRAYLGRAVELITYLQIISRTEAEFKGLTLLNYEEQFRRPAAHDLSPNRGLVIWSCGPSRSRVRLNLIASPVTAPSPTQLPLREALFLHTATKSISHVDVPAVPVRSLTCAAAAASRLIRLCDATQVNWRTLPRFSPPATAARNKVPQQSRSQYKPFFGFLSL